MGAERLFPCSSNCLGGPAVAGLDLGTRHQGRARMFASARDAAAHGSPSARGWFRVPNSVLPPVRGRHEVTSRPQTAEKWAA